MNNLNFDINSYTDISDMVGFDGFIGPDGEFYRVKKRHSTDINLTHLTWSDYYIKNDSEKLNILLTPSYSMIYTLSKLKSKQDLLIHFFGFVYYSHDHLTNEPIIIPPDPLYNNKNITKEQLDTLYQIMDKNLEDPLNHEIFNQSDYYKRYR